MTEPMTFTPAERLWLGVVGLVGLVGLNGLFVYGLLQRRGALVEALRNPIALAFIVEAFVVMGLLAWLFAKWQRNRLGWGWFVALCLVGGLAFGIPAVLLAPGAKRGPGQ
jgi:predicted Na+-dependent transporter